MSLLALALVALPGCGATRLRADFKGYENAYAESSNRQMLLNLARLNQHHPTYFFKMGQISTQYRVQFGLNGNGTYSPTGNANGVGGGGTPNLLYEQDPIFQFIPVGGDVVAQQLLTPIDPQHFYDLFNQGYRLDQLMRLLVDRIEYSDPKTGALQIIRNTPSGDNVEGYLTFLRVSALAYELQRRGHLVITGKPSSFQVIMTGLPAPLAKDVNDTQAKNLIWRQTADGKSWELGQDVPQFAFQLILPVLPEKAKQTPDKDCPDKFNSADNLLLCEIYKDMPLLKDVQSLAPTIGLLKAGLAIKGNYATQDTTGAEPAHFVLRSFIGAIAAASQEDNVFDAILNKGKKIPDQARIPPEEADHPLLKLIWSGKIDAETQLTPSLVELDYMGKTYRVADEKSDDPLKQSSWNRDMFRLIFEISSRVTVDISKFPPPQVLYLRTQ